MRFEMETIARDEFEALKAHLPCATREGLFETYRISQNSWYKLRDGKPVIGFQIMRSKGFSDVQVAKDVRAHFGDKVYDAVIPRNVRVSEAPSFGKPALIYDLKCAGSQAYLRLAREVVARERLRRAA